MISKNTTAKGVLNPPHHITAPSAHASTSSHKPTTTTAGLSLGAGHLPLSLRSFAMATYDSRYNFSSTYASSPKGDEYDLPSPPNSAAVHKGFISSHPFAAREKKKRTLIDSLISTAFFKCWHILTFFLVWATIVVVVNEVYGTKGGDKGAKGAKDGGGKEAKKAIEGAVKGAVDGAAEAVGEAVKGVANHTAQAVVQLVRRGDKEKKDDGPTGPLMMPDTLLKVVGTVLGFVTSTRTSTSFERYNTGKALWYKLVNNSRTLSRMIWYNVPEMKKEDGTSTPEQKARNLIEKRTILNLILAHAVSLKHYLRHEDGIYYKDLYYLVKFLPAYVERQSLGTPTAQDGDNVFRDINIPVPAPASQDPFTDPAPAAEQEDHWSGVVPYNIPLPRSPLPPRSAAPRSPYLPSSPRLSSPRPGTPKQSTRKRLMSRMGFHRSRHTGAPAKAAILSKHDEQFLLPARKPPKYHLFELWPFSLLVRFLSQKYKDKQSKRAKMKELLRRKRVRHNLPLEITLYIGSYITMIQKRKIADNLTMNQMNNHLNQMLDAATNLERIATTPLPFIYGIHMWLINLMYCFLLPLQIYKSMKILTIPFTGLMAFFYFGFLVAGEELEDPFGYDKNDLDLDHFTNNIMRNELLAITSAPPPDPERWMFVEENNVLFSNLEERISPEMWVGMGPKRIQNSLRML